MRLEDWTEYVIHFQRALRLRSIPFHAEVLDLEIGQPLADLEEARRFFGLCRGAAFPTRERTCPLAVLPPQAPPDGHVRHRDPSSKGDFLQRGDDGPMRVKSAGSAQARGRLPFATRVPLRAFAALALSVMLLVGLGAGCALDAGVMQPDGAAEASVAAEAEGENAILRISAG